MRIFRSIVEPFVLPMLHARQDFMFCRSIALQFIGNDHARDVLLLFEKLAEKSLRSLLVASALNQDIKHIPILVDSSPEIMGFSIDFEKDFIQVPFVATTRASPSQFVGVRLPKLQAPLPHCFIGYDDPSLCQQFFDITKTERKAKIQPDGVADNFRRVTKAFLCGGNDVCFHEIILAPCFATPSS
jgi:hypothetical protein